MVLGTVLLFLLGGCAHAAGGAERTAAPATGATERQIHWGGAAAQEHSTRMDAQNRFNTDALGGARPAGPTVPATISANIGGVARANGVMVGRVSRRSSRSSSTSIARRGQSSTAKVGEPMESFGPHDPVQVYDGGNLTTTTVQANHSTRPTFRPVKPPHPTVNPTKRPAGPRDAPKGLFIALSCIFATILIGLYIVHARASRQRSSDAEIEMGMVGGLSTIDEQREDDSYGDDDDDAALLGNDDDCDEDDALLDFNDGSATLANNGGSISIPRSTAGANGASASSNSSRGGAASAQAQAANFTSPRQQQPAAPPPAMPRLQGRPSEVFDDPANNAFQLQLDGNVTNIIPAGTSIGVGAASSFMHGVIDKPQVAQRLKKVGAYLVRESKTAKGQYVLCLRLHAHAGKFGCCKWIDPIFSTLLEFDAEDGYRLPGHRLAWPTVEELVRHYVDRQIPLTAPHTLIHACNADFSSSANSEPAPAPTPADAGTLLQPRAGAGAGSGRADGAAAGAVDKSGPPPGAAGIYE